jgi:CBS domain-containing protein
MNPDYDINFIDGTEDHLFPAIDGTVLRRSLKTLMKPAFCVEIDTPISEAIHAMQTRRMGCVLVTSHRKLLGIFTERDVLKKILGVSFDLKATPIAEVMTTNPQALNDDDTIAYAMNFMDLGGYRHIPIVNHDFVPVGVVSVKDIVSYFVEHFADEVLSLPPHPYASADDALPVSGDLPEEDSAAV